VFGIQQIHSDLMQIATDLRAYLRNVQDEAWLDHIEVGDTINVQPFINRGQDVTAGWVFTITFEIDDVMNYCAIPLVGSTPAPPFSCAPATVIVLNSDGTQVDGGTVVSGGTGTFEAPDSTYIVQYINGTIIEQGTIPSGESVTVDVPNPIICQDATWELFNTDGSLLDSGTVVSGGSVTITAPDGTAVLSNTGGTQISSTPIASGEVIGIIAPDGVVTIQNSLSVVVNSGFVESGSSNLFSAPDGTASNSDASFTLSVPSGGTAPIPDSQINVNGNNEGNVISVKPINVNLTDGTNPVTPDSVTLVGNTLTLEAPVINWKRNPLWQPIPPDDNTGTKAYFIYGVFEDAQNNPRIVTTSGVQINWGDGTIVTSTGNDTHTYNYASIVAPIIAHPLGGNYKPVLVTITAPTVAQIHTFNMNNNQHGEQWLDAVIYAGDGTTTATNGACRYNMFRSRLLERFKCKHPQSAQAANSNFENCISLRVFDVPSDFFNYFITLPNVMLRAGNYCTLPNITSPASIVGQAFSQSRLKVGSITLNSATTLQNFMVFTASGEVGNIEALICTDGRGFGSSINVNLQKVGAINMPLLQNATEMFRNGNMPSIVFISTCANINNTLAMFDGCQNLQECIMPNLTIGVSLNGCRMSAQALNDFMTSIGTASGSQTLDLRNNPGSATCDTTIGTGKGYTVLIA
jgi:hypothetical protein